MSANYIYDLDDEIAAAMAPMQPASKYTYAKGERIQVERATQKARERRTRQKLERIEAAQAEIARFASRGAKELTDEIVDLEAEMQAMRLAGRPDRVEGLMVMIRNRRDALDSIKRAAGERTRRLEQTKTEAVARVKQQAEESAAEAIAELKLEIAALEAQAANGKHGYLQRTALTAKKAMLARREMKLSQGLTVSEGAHERGDAVDEAAPRKRKPRMTRARRIELILQEIGRMRDAGASAGAIASKFRDIADIREGKMTYAQQKAEAAQKARDEAKAKARADALDKAYRKRQQAKSEAYRQAQKLTNNQ